MGTISLKIETFLNHSFNYAAARFWSSRLTFSTAFLRTLSAVRSSQRRTSLCLA
ncbi:Uncharacterised protein [Paenibacillus macerans]|uniref:Uncharacterized protein n=1 Tax=Paenibacillus macerans TaxID=44252 RepID=A0A090ZDT8_PAEMA|nr:hypothetical protein DJ90_1792 [Paenibacillus macerans]SUA83813.1 Uncharacterised protein [Paenibacillus macerans]